MKILTLVGTRPELIRLSIIIKKLDKLVDHILVHTNQNYDYNLSGKFFDELGIRGPDYSFKPMVGSFGNFLGSALIEFENVLIKEQPDKILILGDTNSGLLSIIADRYKIPVYHMEAGNRCSDKRVPEETNRILIDHLSKYNLPYTENSKQNLINEGFDKNYVFKIGNPIYEVLVYYEYAIDNSKILDELFIQSNNFVLVTAHRAENVDNIESLSNIVRALNEMAKKITVVFSIHPRTKDKLNKYGLELCGDIVGCSPMGFFDFVKLEKTARLVISDCLHPDTFIILSNGLIKNIKNITTGDTIVSNDSYELVQNKESKTGGVKYSIRTKYNEIKCSENHRLFVKSDDGIIEKKAKDITKLDRLVSSCGIRVVGNEVPSLVDVENVDYVKIKEVGLNIIKDRAFGDPLCKFGQFKSNTLYSKKGVNRKTLYGVLNYLSIDIQEFDKYIYYDETMLRKRQIKITQPGVLDESLAELVGFLCGDGYVLPNIRISLYDKDEENLIYFGGIFKKIFNVDYSYKKDSRNNCKYLSVYSKTLTNFFIENFYSECQTTLTKEKDISDIIMTSSDSIVAAYIRGLFEAGGFVGDHGFAITMSDKSVIYKLKYLLLRFGIISNVYEFKPRRKKDKSILYQLCIYEYTSRELFRDKIGFISTYKKNNTKKLFDKINKQKYCRAVKRYGSIFFDLIRDISIVDDGCDYIDIHVEPTNAFLANCILSHNSGTVQEEMCIFGVPSLTIRNTTERHETIECGSNILVGTNYDDIMTAFNASFNRRGMWTPPADYMVHNVSDIVIKILLGAP